MLFGCCFFNSGIIRSLLPPLLSPCLVLLFVGGTPLLLKVSSCRVVVGEKTRLSTLCAPERFTSYFNFLAEEPAILIDTDLYWNASWQPGGEKGKAADGASSSFKVTRLVVSRRLWWGNRLFLLGTFCSLKFDCSETKNQFNKNRCCGWLAALVSVIWKLSLHRKGGNCTESTVSTRSKWVIKFSAAKLNKYQPLLFHYGPWRHTQAWGFQLENISYRHQPLPCIL